MNNKYKLRYLPIFYDDLQEAVSYIADTLNNKQAAINLLDMVEKAILERLPVAESFEIYSSKRERRYPYYRIYVKNYIVFYVVINDAGEKPVMEVRRLVYNKRNYKSYI